jgi:hypothetical protein
MWFSPASTRPRSIACLPRSSWARWCDVRAMRADPEGRERPVHGGAASVQPISSRRTGR